MDFKQRYEMQIVEFLDLLEGIRDEVELPSDVTMDMVLYAFEEVTDPALVASFAWHVGNWCDNVALVPLESKYSKEYPLETKQAILDAINEMSGGVSEGFLLGVINEPEASRELIASAMTALGNVVGGTDVLFGIQQSHPDKIRQELATEVLDDLCD